MHHWCLRCPMQTSAVAVCLNSFRHLWRNTQRALVCHSLGQTLYLSVLALAGVVGNSSSGLIEHRLSVWGPSISVVARMAG